MDWPLNWHDGTFDGFFRQECKDGKACIVVVKSTHPQVYVRHFLKELHEHEWPLPQSVRHTVAMMQAGWPPGIHLDRVDIPKRARDSCFYRMDLREWNDMVHKYASQVAIDGRRLLYLGIVKPELNPACATTEEGGFGISMWCPVHVEQLGKDDDRKTPIRTHPRRHSVGEAERGNERLIVDVVLDDG